MGRRLQPLDSADHLQVFANELRALRDTAGSAGTFSATHGATGISKSTYHAWLQGKQLPSRDLFDTVVKQWRGDVPLWAKRRREVEAALVSGKEALRKVVGAPIQFPENSRKEHARGILEITIGRNDDLSCYILLTLFGIGVRQRGSGFKYRFSVSLSEMITGIREITHGHLPPGTVHAMVEVLSDLYPGLVEITAMRPGDETELDCTFRATDLLMDCCKRYEEDAEEFFTYWALAHVI